MRSGHGIKHQRGVADGARQHTIGGYLRHARAPHPPRNSSARRLETDNAAIGCRHSNRAAAVGAVVERPIGPLHTRLPHLRSIRLRSEPGSRDLRSADQADSSSAQRDRIRKYWFSPETPAPESRRRSTNNSSCGPGSLVVTREPMVVGTPSTSTRVLDRDRNAQEGRRFFGVCAQPALFGRARLRDREIAGFGDEGVNRRFQRPNTRPDYLQGLHRGKLSRRKRGPQIERRKLVDLCHLQILNLHRLDLAGGREAEDAPVEVQLRLRRALDVRRLAEAVLLALKRDVGNGQALLPQRIDHPLGLVGRHDLVLQTLEKNNRTGEPVDGMDGGALLVQFGAFGVGADQRVEVARLELVRVLRQRRGVGDAVGTTRPP